MSWRPMLLAFALVGLFAAGTAFGYQRSDLVFFPEPTDPNDGMEWLAWTIVAASLALSVVTFGSWLVLVVRAARRGPAAAGLKYLDDAAARGTRSDADR